MSQGLDQLPGVTRTHARTHTMDGIVGGAIASSSASVHHQVFVLSVDAQGSRTTITNLVSSADRIRNAHDTIRYDTIG
jgi:hypothetical protein